jgi:pyruvate, water dikinase
MESAMNSTVQHETQGVAEYVARFETLGMGDVERVGGKNASLGEMIHNLTEHGVRVPGGFATTADAFREYLAKDGLVDRIAQRIASLNVEDTMALAAAGREIRSWMMEASLPAGLETAIRHEHRLMCAEAGEDLLFAVRSSATAEDLPDASFAGQQETFLNIRGADNLIDAVKRCFASLYNDRAIAYRAHQGFDHGSVALSAGIQRMVRSDLGAAGVMFTLDTESGFRDVVFINAAYGLGETVVQGSVNPDEYYVHKPTLKLGKRPVVRKTLGGKAIRMVFAGESVAERSTRVEDVPAPLRHQFALTDEELLELARYAMTIEDHYGRPMDIEWGRDGLDGKLYILQARPETVKSRAGNVQVRFRMLEKGPVITQGRAIGSKVGQGRARVIKDIADMHHVQPGDVLVADMTDPDWEPVMKRAAAIVTNRGGRTCHAAIVARELGVPAVVGTGNGTQVIKDGDEVTVSCAEGEDGFVYAGLLQYERTETSTQAMPEIPVKIMMNVGNPEQAFHFAMLPNDGVGLARLEFIINNAIGIHPNAALEYRKMPEDVKAAIDARTQGYADPVTFYVEKLAEGIGTLAAAFWPKRVIVRMSDFKSNEYANLIGGPQFEPHEENPMLGFRGAGRYASPQFRRAFQLECRAMKRVRDDMGLTNVEIMLPFVRTLEDADAALGVLAENGLERGRDGLKVVMMCEIPANVLLADRFLKRFDGFSIGSNDLTQLTLGVDRDSSLVAASFDERNPAVKKLLSDAISTCKRMDKYVGICGQGPSDHPDLAEWLMQQGIDSLSLNPDTVVSTWMRLALR